MGIDDTVTPDTATPSPEDFSEALNAQLSPWDRAMGVRFVRATGDEVVAEVQVTTLHHQPYGIVHGGVYASLVETVASVAAALSARARDQSVVGLENHTSFLHAARDGVLRATGRPLTRGRRTHVWEVQVRDGAEKLLASGRVRLLALEAQADLVGKRVDPGWPR